ncbi:MAG: spore coat protein [Christensenellales bacterium]|jgi:spore coat protein F
MNNQFFNQQGQSASGSTGPSMTEQELLTDLLNQEKQLMGTYSHFIMESSCPNMRQMLQDQFNQTCQDQFSIFKNMQQRGYYKTKDASDADVTQAKQDAQQLQTQMA